MQYTSQASLHAVGTVGFAPHLIGPAYAAIAALSNGGKKSAHSGQRGTVTSQVSTQPGTFQAQQGKAPTSAMDFEINKRLAQRELQALVGQLQQALPTANSITIFRHTGGGGSGKNYSTSLGPGAHPVLHSSRNPNNWMLKEYSRVIVRPGTRLIAWQNTNFSGKTLALGPGDHNLFQYGWNDKKGPKSGVIIPDVDFESLINAAAQKIVDLSSPQNGCLIDARSFQGGQITHPALTALMGFLDKVIAITQGSPMGQKYQTMKATLPGQIAQGVLANMQVCQQAQSAPPAQTAPTAPPPVPTQQFGPFWFVIGGQAVGPVASSADVKARIAKGEITKTSWAWKAGMPSWAQAGNIAELKPLFGAAPPTVPTAPAACSTKLWRGVCLPASLAGCEASGGFLQARINTLTGKVRKDTIACIRPQGSRSTVRHEASGVAGLKSRRRRRRGVGQAKVASPLFSQRPLEAIEQEYMASQGMGSSMAAPPIVPPPTAADTAATCPPCDCPPGVWPKDLTKDSDPDEVLKSVRDNFGQFRKDARTFQRGMKTLKEDLGEPFTQEMSSAITDLTRSAGDVRKLARDYLSGDWAPSEAGSQAAILKALGVSGPAVGSIPFGRFGRSAYGTGGLVAFG